MKIQILVDNKKSWIIPYVFDLIQMIKEQFGVESRLLHCAEEVEKGDVLFLLSCEKIFKRLELNTYNIVVHESKLPKGKGWSPLSWQVLEGKSKIPVTLFEATNRVDSGVIYLQEYIELNGKELLPELKEKQGNLTNQMILDFLRLYPDIQGREQYGEETFYKKRTPKDSELDIAKSIQEQFNLLRICDNERYPAFFIYEGEKYFLKIEKQVDNQNK